MKLLITTDTASDVWQYTTELCHAYKDEKMDILLLAMGPKPSKEQMHQISDIKNVIFNHFDCKLEWMDQAWEDVEEAISWIRQKAIEYQIDILHFNHFAPSNHLWNQPVVLSAHSSLTIWWNRIKKTSFPKRLETYDEMVKKAIHNANVVVTTTKSQKREFEAFYGEIENCWIINNSCSSITQKNTAPAKEPFILSHGRILDESKNIRLLVEAAENIHAKIYIAGENYGSVGQAENLVFLGNISKEELYPYYERASAFVLPVKYDAFGYSFLEAASHNCALIGGNVETLKEVWGENMLYVEAGDAQQLAEICNHLLSDKSKLMKMANRANESFRELSESNNAKQYLNLYGKLMEVQNEKKFA